MYIYIYISTYIWEKEKIQTNRKMCPLMSSAQYDVWFAGQLAGHIHDTTQAKTQQLLHHFKIWPTKTWRVRMLLRQRAHQEESTVATPCPWPIKGEPRLGLSSTTAQGSIYPKHGSPIGLNLTQSQLQTSTNKFVTTHACLHLTCALPSVTQIKSCYRPLASVQIALLNWWYLLAQLATNYCIDHLPCHGIFLLHAREIHHGCDHVRRPRVCVCRDSRLEVRSRRPRGHGAPALKGSLAFFWFGLVCSGTPAKTYHAMCRAFQWSDARRYMFAILAANNTMCLSLSLSFTLSRSLSLSLPCSLSLSTYIWKTNCIHICRPLFRGCHQAAKELSGQTVKPLPLLGSLSTYQSVVS